MPGPETVCDGEHELIGEALGLQANVTVTFVLFHPAELAAGDTDAEIVGSACSRFTFAEAVVVFPARSVAEPETGWFAPSLEINVEAGQVATPENESVQVKVTVTGAVSHPLEFGAGEILGITLGGVLSSLMIAEAVAVAPAASVTVPLTGILAPSVEMICGVGQLVIGAAPGAGVHVKLTITFVLFQPAALGSGATTAMICGGTSEMFTVNCVEAVFPATSVTVPLATWFAPGVAILCAGGHAATPESVSAHMKLTVTDELFHPAVFGAGEGLAVMVGGVLSMLTVAHASSEEFPAASTACPQRDWFAPSVATATGGGQVLTPDPLSKQVNVTVTLVLFHPAAFGRGKTETAIVGTVVSVVNVCETTLLELPARSKTVNWMI